MQKHVCPYAMLEVVLAQLLNIFWQCCSAEAVLQAAQVLGNNPNYVSYVPACGVPSHVTALHHRYSTDFPVRACFDFRMPMSRSGALRTSRCT